MAVELKQFIAQLSASQLLAAADVETFVAALAPPPADGEQLARELVKHKKLTAFQGVHDMVCRAGLVSAWEE